MTAKVLISYSPDFSIDAGKPWLVEIPVDDGRMWFSDEFATWREAMDYAELELTNAAALSIHIRTEEN